MAISSKLFTALTRPKADMPPNSNPIIAQGLFSYQIGGSERVGADLAIEFKRRGYRVVCFAFYDTHGPIRAELEANGVECVDLNYLTHPWGLRRLTYQIAFFRFLRLYRVDALLVHHATALILCGIAARLARVRRVVMVEHAVHQLRERPDYRRSAIRYLRFANVTTAVDPGIVEYFRDELHTPPDRLVYIANGVRMRPPNPEHRAAMRSRLELRPGEFAFLFVGRLQPVKDVPTLLAAFAEIDNTTRWRMRLLIAGDGPERERLLAQSRSLGIQDHVQFLGARRDVPDLLAAADAFVMSSVTEGQPMALIEAMAAGLPCLATAVGGIPALLDDGAGLMVPPSSPSALAAAMTRLQGDAQLRAQCVAAGLNKVSAKHSLDVVTDRYLDVLGLAPRAIS